MWQPHWKNILVKLICVYLRSINKIINNRLIAAPLERLDRKRLEIIYMNKRGASFWAILIVLAFMAAAFAVAFWPQVDVPVEADAPFYERYWAKAKAIVSNLGEEARIEKWITDNLLNQYGEPADTLYAGGTPLFDPATGETMDRHDYIRQNHPERPWNK